MRGIDHDHVAARRNQRLGAIMPIFANRRGGGHAQAALTRPWRRCGCLAAFSMSLTVMRPMQR